MAKHNRTGVGLDVGNRSVQLAVLRPKKGGVAVERLASKELPHDAIVDGAVMDAQVVTEKISELLRENHLKNRDVAISIGGRRLMIKKIATDEMSDDELKATISYEAKSNLPFDVSEVSLDYARLDQNAEAGHMEVLLVAAKNEVVFDAVETLRGSGGKPALLEGGPFALQAALGAAGYFEDQAAVATLDIGFQAVDVTLFTGGQYAGNRGLSVGGKSYVEGLIRELGIPFERAAQLLANTQRSPEEEEALNRVATLVSEKIAEQVERSFPEYFAATSESPVTRLVLCGGGAHLPMLEAALRERFGREVVIADPFRRFEVRDKNIAAMASESAPDYASAVGLALRAMGDEYPGFNLLLPTDRPEYKKTAYAGLGTVLPVVAISALVFAMVMTYLTQEGQLAGLNARLQEVRKESALYHDKILLVEELSRKRADVATRIDVISGLDRNRFARVMLLQLVTDNLPALTWVTNVQEARTPRGPGFNLSGVTSSNLKVSELMTNLLKSDGVQGVDLLVSEQTEIADIEVTKFTLQVAMPQLGVVEPATPEQVNLIKKGAEALREKREAEDQLKKEASK